MLLDIYGTIFISGSGEVGTLRETACDEAFGDALGAVGLEMVEAAPAGAQYLFDAIEASHKRSRAEGVDYPEVEITQVWQNVVRRLADEDLLRRGNPESVDWRLLAVEYEARANPVWPMPGFAEFVGACRQRGLLLGIVSNAQFFTRELFPAFLGKALGQLGFDRVLEVLSCEHGRAKPGTWLFELAVARLQTKGLEPSATLYVGNDMLNDVLPARQVGFRTALFAGDQRSYRPRVGDPRIEGAVPDLTVTQWRQLAECCMVPKS